MSELVYKRECKESSLYEDTVIMIVTTIITILNEMKFVTVTNISCENNTVFTQNTGKSL